MPISIGICLLATDLILTKDRKPARQFYLAGSSSYSLANPLVLRVMNFARLKKDLEGDLFTDETTRKLYATDASAYREIPVAVAIPKTEEDLVKLVDFCNSK